MSHLEELEKELRDIEVRISELREKLHLLRVEYEENIRAISGYLGGLSPCVGQKRKWSEVE